MINFDRPSPFPLVSHWPDEDEKHHLIKTNFNLVLNEAESVGLIVDPRVLAGGAKHHIRKRANQAAHSSREVHQAGNRERAFETNEEFRRMQELSLTQIPVERVQAFLENPLYPALEFYSTSRVGERGLAGNELADAAVEWTTEVLAAKYTAGIPEDAPVFKIPGGFSDLQRMEYIADVTLKTHLKTYTSKVDPSVTIDLKARQIGVIPMTDGWLTGQEMLKVGFLAHNKKKGLTPEQLAEPKEVLKQLVARDALLPDEERLLEPSTMTVYLCRSGLELAQSSEE